LILLELRDLNLSNKGLIQNFGFEMSGKFLTLQCSKELALLSGTSGIIGGRYLITTLALIFFTGFRNTNLEK